MLVVIDHILSSKGSDLQSGAALHNQTLYVATFYKVCFCLNLLCIETDRKAFLKHISIIQN